MMLATRRPRSCLARRCNTETECPFLSSSATSSRPRYPVPPITRQFMLAVARLLVVVLQPQVRDQILAAHPAQRVLELHELDEDVMLRVQSGRGHRSFEIERQPFLNATHAATLGQ